MRRQWGEDGPTAVELPGGAGATLGHRGWVLVEDEADRVLGRALLWGRRHRIDDLHILLKGAGGTACHPRTAAIVARRATAFARRPSVWEVEGGTVSAVLPAAPETSPPPPAEVARWADVLAAAGAEPVVEGGTLVGEVLGLEVARVVADDSGTRLEVGVGKHDRHAQQLIGSDRPAPNVLADAVATVRRHRRSGAPLHPLNRLAPERWLRHRLIDEPGLVGAASLSPIAIDRTGPDDLRAPRPAAAAGEDPRGRPVLVVCSVGIDLELVPAAADARLADDRRPRLVLVVPEGDDHPVTRSLAGALTEPAEVVTVSREWRRP